MTRERILICDDEEGILKYLKKLLEQEGYAVETFANGAALLERLRRGDPEDADLLLQDMRMPDMEGIEVLLEMKKIRSTLPAIIMTAFGSIDQAVQAVKMGAYDYITKPFPREKILGVLKNALERESLVRENSALKNRIDILQEKIVFRSETFRKIHDFTVQVAASEANILVLGESGTGKELIAGALHRHSRRKGRRFVSVNCAALSDTLLESQLFGHLRGAFSGAVANQKGLLEEVDGGTLFLDEIGDMSLTVQGKLLRVIQQREFLPVGATRARSVDVRLVAATNKDLEQEVVRGAFREDLFYRLNVISIQLPPLRERKEDIEPLARHFMQKHASRMKKEMRGVTPEALHLLSSYDWPGNIRELENVMERAVILAAEGSITPELFPLWRRSATTTAPEQALLSLDAIEKEHIERTLQKTGYHKSRSAEILGISRKTLDRKIQEYAIAL